MKHLLLISLFAFAVMPVMAHPQTTSVVTHPQTNVVSVVKPRTNAVVTRPATTVQVQQPMTAGGATANFVKGTGEDKVAGSAKPATPVPSGKTVAAGSYTPSYKKAKDLTPKKAEQNMAASGGLGLKDPAAGQKEADARAFQVQKALDSGSFDKIVPPEIMGKLKQRNHEAAKAAGKK